MTQSNDDGVTPEGRNTLEYAEPTSRSRLSRSSRLVLWCAVATVGAFLAFTLAAPFLNQRHPEENLRLTCERNIRQIALGIGLFANEHGEKFPDDLATMYSYANGDLDARVFVCPLTGDTPAAGPTTQATAAAVRQPGHCSYIYLGKGLNYQTVTADTVVLYEPLTNHAGDGMHVLFGDLRVQWLTPAEAQTILKQVAAGTTPVRFPTTATATAPAPR